LKTQQKHPPPAAIQGDSGPRPVAHNLKDSFERIATENTEFTEIMSKRYISIKLSVVSVFSVAT
jgi:hypothetical protein